MNYSEEGCLPPFRMKAYLHADAPPNLPNGVDCGD